MMLGLRAASDRVAPPRALLHAAALLATALLFVVSIAPVLADEATGDRHGQGAAEPHDAHGDAAMPEPTAEERAAADALLAGTRTGTARFADPEVALSEGYTQGTPYAFYGLRAAHFHNETYNQDGKLLDPERPENLMFVKTEDGTLELIGVMFIAPPGQGPRPGGPLTNWHTHPDLCGGQEGVILKNPDGTCPAETYPVDFEMLHVWLIDVPGGPFADNPLGEIEDPLVGAGSEHNSIVAGAGLVDAEGLMREIGDLLRLTSEEIGRRYEAGESLAEIAEAQGVGRAELAAFMTDRLTVEYDEAVARGDMTARQRELTVRHLPTIVERMIELHAGEPWLKEK